MNSPDIHVRAGWRKNIFRIGSKSSDCTNFVSYALRNGGLLETDEWNPSRLSWVNTPSLYQFLSSKFNVITFENAKIAGYLIHKVPRENEKWAEFLKTNEGKLLPGDIVFYWDSKTIQDWGHAAIIGDISAETGYIYPKTGNGVQKPSIYEHSGPDLRGNSQPRSIDDTDNEWIGKISIIQVRPRH